MCFKKSQFNAKVAPLDLVTRKLTILVLSARPGLGKTRWIYRMSGQCGDRLAPFQPTLGFNVTRSKLSCRNIGDKAEKENSNSDDQNNNINVNVNQNNFNLDLTLYEVGGLITLQSLWKGYLLDSDGVIFMAQNPDDLTIFMDKVLPFTRRAVIFLMDGWQDHSTKILTMKFPNIHNNKIVRLLPFDPIKSFSDTFIFNWFLVLDSANLSPNK